MSRHPPTESGPAHRLASARETTPAPTPGCGAAAPERADLLAAISRAFEELAGATIMFHQVVADRLGMNVTDHKCAGILWREGPLAAGALAERTGLTTGAITGVIDRLEKAGYVRRTRDPEDRRRVIVEPIHKRIEQRMVPLFTSMARAAAQLCAPYSAEELRFILDFTRRAAQMGLDETTRLRERSTRGLQRTRAGKQ